MLPEPDGALPNAPPVAVEVHVALTISAGKKSERVMFAEVLGPLFPTVTVYTTMPSGVKLPADCFTTNASATGVRVSVSVAVLSPPDGSDTPGGGRIVAVLTSAPLADGLTNTVRV